MGPFFAWQAHARPDNVFGMIADPPPSSLYLEDLALLALVSLAFVIPFLAGRFWARNVQLRRGPRIVATMALATGLALPCCWIIYEASRGKYLGSPTGWATFLLPIAGLAVFAGMKKGRQQPNPDID